MLNHIPIAHPAFNISGASGEEQAVPGSAQILQGVGARHFPPAFVHDIARQFHQGGNDGGFFLQMLATEAKQEEIEVPQNPGGRLRQTAYARNGLIEKEAFLSVEKWGRQYNGRKGPQGLQDISQADLAGTAVGIEEIIGLSLKLPIDFRIAVAEGIADLAHVESQAASEIIFIRWRRKVALRPGRRILRWNRIPFMPEMRVMTQLMDQIG